MSVASAAKVARLAKIKADKNARRLAQMRATQAAERNAINRVYDTSIPGTFKTVSPGKPKGSLAYPARDLVYQSQRIGMSRGYDPKNSYDALTKGAKVVFSRKGAMQARGQYKQPPRITRPKASRKPTVGETAAAGVFAGGAYEEYKRRKNKKN